MNLQDYPWKNLFVGMKLLYVPKPKQVGTIKEIYANGDVYVEWTEPGMRSHCSTESRHLTSGIIVVSCDANGD